MRDLKLLLVPVFLVAQALFAHWIATAERPPQPPDLAMLPPQIGEWTFAGENAIAADVAHELGADRTIDRNYARKSTASITELFIAWFQSQRGGASQPHSPKVCLPGSGWTPDATDEITLTTSAGPIVVNRYIVSKGQQRAVVLYWYQTPRRVVAGEWAAKLWLVADALRDQRTDTSLVRVLTWVTDSSNDHAVTQATDFARELYPRLRSLLPNLQP